MQVASSLIPEMEEVGDMGNLQSHTLTRGWGSSISSSLWLVPFCSLVITELSQTLPRAAGLLQVFVLGSVAVLTATQFLTPTGFFLPLGIVEQITNPRASYIAEESVCFGQRRRTHREITHASASHLKNGQGSF